MKAEFMRSQMGRSLPEINLGAIHLCSGDALVCILPCSETVGWESKFIGI